MNSIFSRFCLGICLLLYSVAGISPLAMVAQLVVAVVALVYVDRGAILIRRSIIALSWLVVPILLLHGLFTPGRILAAAGWITISNEGLQQGGWLSLRLAVIFLSGLLLAKLLARDEWIRLMLAIPGINGNFISYLLILDRGWPLVRALISEGRATGDRKMNPKTMIRMMSTLPATSMALSSSVAADVWNRWGDDLESIRNSDHRQNISATVVSLLWFFTMFQWYFYATVQV